MPTVLVGTRLDEAEDNREIPKKKQTQWSSKNNVPAFEVSALTGTTLLPFHSVSPHCLGEGVMEAVQSLITNMTVKHETVLAERKKNKSLRKRTGRTRAKARRPSTYLISRRVPQADHDSATGGAPVDDDLNLDALAKFTTFFTDVHLKEEGIFRVTGSPERRALLVQMAMTNEQSTLPASSRSHLRRQFLIMKTIAM